MILQFNVTGNPHRHRQFCTVLDDVYLKNTGKDLSDGSAAGLIEIIHDDKLVKAGIDKDTQKMGDREIYYPNQYSFDTKADIELDEEIFLLFDDAGINYQHFFFDLFGKCIYYDELLKTNPNLKIGIAQEFWTDTGKNNHIKQWLQLYYSNLEPIIFETDKSYKIKQITLPNCLYWFPEGQGHDPIMDMIKSVADKIQPDETKQGCYISRQDAVKYGWYHNREMANELELISRIESELGYDIIEMMNYTLADKIKLSKSYKNIIQQSSASNINILFSDENVTNTILSNPRMGPWQNYKNQEYSVKSGANLLVLDDVGELIKDTGDLSDSNNYPWQLTDIDGVMGILKQVDDGSIWNSQ
jgi:hypothetical protein